MDIDIEIREIMKQVPSCTACGNTIEFFMEVGASVIKCSLCRKKVKSIKEAVEEIFHKRLSEAGKRGAKAGEALRKEFIKLQEKRSCKKKKKTR